MARSTEFDAVVERMVHDLRGEWSAEPLEAALADIALQQPADGGQFGWSTYHPPAYRITLSLSAVDAEAATALAHESLALPDGWRLDPETEVRPANR